jgi:nucleotide sugar dehydrogenase
MNELAILFDKIGIDTLEVLQAAGTKWNFLPFRPGLVGGHCIGVDPYYLTYRAQQLGYHPQVILAGRQINDSMPIRVGEMVIKGLSDVGKPLKGSTALLMGLTFKENVPDIRNSHVHDTILYLQDFGVKVLGCDPLLTPNVVRKYFGIENVEFEKAPNCDCVLIVNKHNAFRSLTFDQLKSKMNPPVLIDIKNLFDRRAAQAAGFYYRSL